MPDGTAPDDRSCESVKVSRKLAPPPLPLPLGWPATVRASLLHALSAAHFVMTVARGWAADSRIPRVVLAAELDRLRCKIAELEEELRIKDARLAKMEPRERPHYAPVDRLAILMLAARQGWTLVETARRFFLTVKSLMLWKKLADKKDSRLVQTPIPVNRFPDFLTVLLHELKRACPRLGKQKIAETLARVGLHISPSTVKRKLEQTPSTPEDVPPTIEPGKSRGAPRSTKPVKATRKNHVWQVDFTTLATDGAATTWEPYAVPPKAPFAWWIGVVIDHFSRRVLGFAVFPKNPSAEQTVDFLRGVTERVGAIPKYLISDQGSQFQSDYRAFCDAKGIKPRFGAIDKHGALAILERFHRSMKEEFLHRILVPFRASVLAGLVARYVNWYNEFRPHRGLGGATPMEVWEGLPPAHARPRLEPRALYPRDAPCAKPHVGVRGKTGAHFRLVVGGFDGARATELPVVELRRAA